jgi:hypothetical protein
VAKTEGKVEEYIGRQKSPQKEVCQKLREIIQRTLPGIDEEMKWGVPAFAQGKFYIVALRDHVNLGFSLNELTADEVKLFDGKGKTMAHIEIRNLKDIDHKRVIRLLELVNSKSS